MDSRIAMSLMGHKGTFAKAINVRSFPRKRTLTGVSDMSALCQERTHALQQRAPSFKFLTAGCYKDAYAEALVRATENKKKRIAAREGVSAARIEAT
jgi:hypothetical protein